MTRAKASWCIALLLAFAGEECVQAQTRTSKMFEDWLATCQVAGGPQSCAMSQTLTEVSTTAIALMWIIDPAADGSMKAIIRTPLGVLLTEGVKVRIGDSQPRKVPFRFCSGHFCTAELAFGADWLSKIRNATVITVDFMSLAGQPVSLDLSLKGFLAAYEYISAR